jgi:hypothetical protein
MNEQLIGKILEAGILALMAMVIFIAFAGTTLQWIFPLFFIGCLLLIMRGIQ